MPNDEFCKISVKIGQNLKKKCKSFQNLFSKKFFDMAPSGSYRIESSGQKHKIPTDLESGHLN
jgi:hypothetical protein